MRLPPAICKATLPTWVHADHCKNLRRVPGEALASPPPNTNIHTSVSFQRETILQVEMLQCYFARIMMDDSPKSPLSMAPSLHKGSLQLQLYGSHCTWETLYKNLRY